jgi:DNA-binding NarL/FixJ family response regulator
MQMPIATVLTVHRLLIVDAHPLSRWGLAALVDAQPDLITVGQTSTAENALALVDELRPDVISIGLPLPGSQGMSLARELRDRYADLGIVILAASGEDDMLFRALDNGASAFVPQTGTGPAFVGAIRHAAAAASTFSAPGLAQAFNRRQQAPLPTLLSPRETQVLTLLQEGMSVSELADTLCISRSTAKTYVGRLYEKLDANNRAQALMAAVRLGLTV